MTTRNRPLLGTARGQGQGIGLGGGKTAVRRSVDNVGFAGSAVDSPT